MTLGETIRTAREKRGMSQRALATKVGVAHPTVSRVETGTRTPSIGLLRRLCDALDLNMGTALDVTK